MTPVTPISSSYSTLSGNTPPPQTPKPSETDSDAETKDTPPPATKSDSKSGGLNVVA